MAHKDVVWFGPQAKKTLKLIVLSFPPILEDQSRNAKTKSQLLPHASQQDHHSRGTLSF